jgi:AcrR family transcriptional regulator
MTEELRRKKPRQARSQQRVDALLDAAASVIAESGYEAATTNAIAARAGVPIGSLYQFFSNKEALLEALLERYAEQMRTLFDAKLTPIAVTSLPLSEVLYQFMLAFAEFEASHIGFKSLFMNVGLPTHLMIHTEVKARVDALLAVRFPMLEPDQRHIAASVGVAIVKGLMALADPPDSIPAPLVVEEVVTALLAYMRAVLLRAGHPLPPDMF